MGVNVPITLAGWLQRVVQVLPMTHGLAAIRTWLAGGPTGYVMTWLAFELAVGLMWIGLAAFGFSRLVTNGRRPGRSSTTRNCTTPPCGEIHRSGARVADEFRVGRTE